MAATTSGSAAAAAAPTPFPSLAEQHMHKNRLQQFAQRTYQKLPIYNVECEGEYHLLKFKCTVEVGGQLFSSTQSFSRRKEAEQDAARVAYETLVTTDVATVGEALELIDQGVVFCKSILNEFAVKKKTMGPSYTIAPQEKPMTLFVASVVFDGRTYTGEAAISKKVAEQKAARAAVKSILGGPDHVAPESQHQASLLTTVQGQNIVPAIDPSVNPSAKAVTHSRKRKGRSGVSDVNGAMIAKEH
ncbi:hypothetical protein EJB05_49514 [Eragrostis curvula]|uniref:DRBM domain-containing protein n=1 Tax=Eragrostis curvula TaxID=38414 RepID=A0A5J9T4Z8_9POAL|nr:hypothetical protein EJB05_49514 [Eragrostis curvula]